MRLNELIEAYGISTNNQLANFAKGIDLPLVEIGFAEDIMINKDGAFIVNLGSNQIGGTHWTGLWIENGHAFYDDSYGVAPEDILVKKIGDYGVSDLSYNDGYEFQRFEEELCGMWVLMFFYFMSINKNLSLDERFKKMTEHYVDTIED